MLKRLQVLCVLLGAVLFSTAAHAAISTPTVIYDDSFNYGHGDGTSVTTTADVPAGSTIVIGLGNQNKNTTFTGVTDSAGNGYTVVVSAAASDVYGAAIAYCVNCLALPSGGTITVSGNGYAIQAAYITGANGGVDKSISSNNGNAQVASISQATGVLAQASEIIFGFVSIDKTASTYIEATGFTPIVGHANYDYFAYDIVSVTTSVAYNPSWTGGPFYTADIVVSFKATAAGAVICTRLLMGVGKC